MFISKNGEHVKSNRDDAGNQDVLLATHCGLDDIGCVMSWSHAAVMSVLLCLSAVHEVQPCGSWSSRVACGRMLQ